MAARTETGMKDIRNIDNPVLKITKEHKLINDYVVRFSKNRKTPDPAFINDLQNFLKFLRTDLKRHHKMEELLFFPAAINGDPSYATGLLVIHLTKEHGVFETRLKAILAVEKRVEKEKGREVLLEKVGNFLDDLKNHVRHEITELFPLIDANPQCMTLLKQYANDLKSDG